MTRFLIVVLAVAILTAGCWPSAEQASMLTAAAAPNTPTATSTPTSTSTPTTTSTPTLTSTPTTIPTSTMTPTATIDPNFTPTPTLDFRAMAFDELIYALDTPGKVQDEGHVERENPARRGRVD